MLLLLLACAEKPGDEWSLPLDSSSDSAPGETGDSGGETGETGESGDSGGETGDTAVGLTLTAVDPAVIDPMGGSRLTAAGAGFAAGELTVWVAGAEASGVEVVSDGELRFTSPPVAAGAGLDLVVRRAEAEATLPLALEAWSPAELDGARVFDAATGVSAAEAATLYEWQRLTAEISPDWRVRDGNTLTWLPSTDRFWMVAGWNGYQEPDGFSSLPPEKVYPPENTTDEVWSSPDGVTWTLELEHQNGAFERRHAHNTVLWNDALWMIGGDTHQGYYNHDVVRSDDGVSWEVVLGPGTTDPPWPERALGITGVYDGRLWTGFGQDLLGHPDDYVYHNDLWVSDDGTTWTEVAADGPGSDTRPEGCGLVDGFVEFQGEMWLVGCARYDETNGHVLRNDVWSTADGVTWTRHADPPWAGKGWPNVVVWDDKLWILFGYTYGDPANGWSAGNANEAWFSEDGETWESLPVDMPVPGSHAQGVAVRGDTLVLAGGNYSFGFGAGYDRSAWQLVPFRGLAVETWTDRGSGLVVTPASEEARPVLVEDAFGDGIPGLQFDGSRSLLTLAAPEGDAQAAGRSVFWVARAPHLPGPWAWEDTYAPVSTVLGGPGASGMPTANLGYTDGQLVMTNLDDDLGKWGEYVYQRVAFGEALQEGPGEARLVGLTHSPDGRVAAWIDGAAAGEATADYGTPRAWSAIGGGLEDGYYGPNTRFGGTLGAVVVLPEVVDEATVARLHAWARGRFGVP